MRKTILLLASAALAVLLVSGVALTGGMEPAEAAFPGNNGQLAFVSDRDGNQEVYAMNADGTNPTRLTTEPSIDFHPAYSPDGKRLTFTTKRSAEGIDNLYVMDSMDADPQDGNGDHPTNVTVDPPGAPSFQSNFSPDGKKIVFVHNEDAFRNEIYVMNADGSGTATRLTYNTAGDSRPVFSPDGTKIAFQRRDQDSPDRSKRPDDIYVMNADGTNETRLTTAAAADSNPEFSPDGTKIAFDSARDGNREIYVMNADGTDQRRLTTAASTDEFPAFSPDGKRLAFSSDRDGNFEIYAMNADGTNQTPLTETAPPVVNTEPDWGNKALANVTLGDLNQTYDGTAKSASATTSPPSLRVDLAYTQNGTQVASPTDAGSYGVVATVVDNDYQGRAQGTLVIAKANQAIDFGAPTGKTYGDEDFDPGATASSGLLVSYASSTPGVCTIVGGKVHIVSAGTCTVTASQAGDANYDPAEDVTRDIVIGKAAATSNVTVTPNSQQYSDKVDLEATLSPASVSGVAPATGVKFFVGSREVGTATLAADDGGLKATLADVVLTEDPANGPYAVKAQFTGVSPDFAVDDATASLAVRPEDATLGYTGPYFAPTGTSPANVALNALVTQANDGSAGDLANANVEFLIYKTSNTTMQAPDYACAAPSASASGDASCQTSLGLDSYTVVVRFKNDSYFDGPQSDPAVLTVYQPATDKYLTGGGWIVDPGYQDKPVATSAADDHGNFGFTVRYKKGSTTEPQGQSVYVFRGADGYDYIVKSNSWTGGALAFPSATTAGFSGKANVTVIDPATGLAVAGLGGGNYNFRVDATDGGSPGTNDQYALSVYTPTGALYHQAGTTASQITLGAGNIVIHSTTTR